jgi:hypothetical protein
MPFPHQIIHNNTLVEDVHEDKKICHQMTLSYDRLLLIPGIFSDNPLVSKCHELNGVVEGLAHRG